MEPRLENCDPQRLATLLETEMTVSPAMVLSEGPGSRIGRYKLLQLIGEGGFGSVFMAEQETPVVRKVAVKIIKLGMDTKQVIARFQAERQALAMMDHPNIAKVLDAGSTETGRPFFVMELVKGIPITEYCDRANLTPRARLELFIPVCKAVQHAHQKGIIHRDLKPGNVLVTLHDGEPVPKVIDFGIAKAVNQRLTEQTLFTEYRQLIGTPEYTSPEQADIGGLDVDTRSDIYSLGVLLYQLLTGTTPFDPKQLRKSVYTEIQRIIREVEPPKPSTRLSTLGAGLETLATHMSIEPARLSRLVAGELDWIVMKCLEKDRARRYDTASALAADVQRHLAGEPVEASPPSTIYRMRKFARKHRVPVLVAIVLVIATVVSSWQAVAATRAKAAALVDNQRANDQAAIAQAVNDFVNDDLLSQASPANQEHREFTPDQDLKVRDALDRAASGIAHRFEKQPLVEAAIRYTIGDAYADLGKYAKAQPQLMRALEIQRSLVGEEHPDTLRTLSRLGQFYRTSGRTAEAIALLEQVRERQIKTGSLDQPDSLRNLSYLAGAYRSAGRINDAIGVLEQVRDRRMKRLGPDHPDTLRTLDELANAYLGAHRIDEAMKLHEQVRDQYVKTRGPDHPFTLDVLNELAWEHGAAGRKNEAVKLWEQELDGQMKIGIGDGNTVRTMYNLARGYRDVGRIDEAIKLFEQVRDQRTKRLGPNHPDTLRILDELASAYLVAHRIDEAIELLEALRDRRTNPTSAVWRPNRPWR